MNELQIALAVIGVLIIVVVIVVNRLQERKYRSMTDVLKPPSEDVLLNLPVDNPAGGRVEPRFDHVPESATPVTRRPGASMEVPGADAGMSFDRARDAGDADDTGEMDVPVLTTSDEIAPLSRLPSPELPPADVNLSDMRSGETRPGAGEAAATDASDHEPAPSAGSLPDEVHPWVDFAVRVMSQQPVEGAAIAEALRSAGLGKPLLVYGYARQGWRELVARDIGRYAHVCAAMQLADRNGAASREELEAFREAVKRITPQGMIKSIDVSEAVRRAGELDHFCVDVDVLIGINIVASEGSALPEARIAELAASAGMTLGRDGLYHLKNESGETLFSLSSHEASPFSAQPEHGLSTSGVTLLLDVPRVADGLGVFDRMVVLGHTLAAELHGSLVDDNIQPLTETGIARIRAQLERIYALMDARGIPSGSALARRLFA